MPRPSAAWPLLLPVLVLAAGFSLPALARAGSSGGGDARRKAADEAGKDGTPSDDSKDEKKDDKDQPKEPPFDKVVKGAKTIEGLFKVYSKEDEGRFYMEIPPERLEVPFLLNPTLVSGIGQGFIYPSDMLPEYVVVFHRIGKAIQLIHRNTLFRA